MKPKPQKPYALRRIDGRLIEVVKTRAEARSRGVTTKASFMEVAVPALATTTIEVHGQPALAALEFVLSLDPATCEKEFIAELDRNVDERYPGDDAA